jgi:putative transposase
VPSTPRFLTLSTYIKVAGCYVYRTIDGSGALVHALFGEYRNMAAAKAFFRSAQAVTGVTPDRVTTDNVAAARRLWPR